MLVQSLGCPAQEVPSSGLSHSAPSTCTAISAANPSLGDVCQHVPLTPTETRSLSLLQLSCYLSALSSLPCQPRTSLEVLTSLMSLLPASQLAALSLLLSCSSCPSTPVPKTGAEALAPQSIATGSDHVSCSHLSCLCSPVHLCSGKRDLFLFTSSVSYSNFLSLSCLPPLSLRCILFTSD